MEETPDEPQGEGPQAKQPVSFHISMPSKTQAEELYRLKDAKETGQLNAACDPGLDLKSRGKGYVSDIVGTSSEA